MTMYMLCVRGLCDCATGSGARLAGFGGEGRAGVPERGAYVKDLLLHTGYGSRRGG